MHFFDDSTYFDAIFNAVRRLLAFNSLVKNIGSEFFDRVPWSS